MTAKEIQAAHEHCNNNRKEIEQSTYCGCFSCCDTFAASDIKEYVGENCICPNVAYKCVDGNVIQA